MKRLGRILIVDDQERWREALSATLRRGNFQVDTAATITQARAQLAATFYHMIVLDIRMEEADQGNVEGMHLLQAMEDSGLTSALAVIMLSAHGTREQMRTAFRQYRVADFLTKEDFDNLEFFEQVQHIFAHELHIHLGLTIHWQNGSRPDQVVIGTEIDNIRVRRDTPLQALLAEELDDLLCRLFYQANSLLVRPLSPGQSGAKVLAVQPFYDAGGAQMVVVKCGDAHKIDNEYRKFKEYVQPFVGGGRSTTVLNLRRTARLGGIVYSLLGVAGDRLEDFGSFYQHAEVTTINTVLDHLFLDTCGAWYANPGRLQPYDLTKDYQTLLGFDFGAERLNEALAERLKSVQGKQRLLFTSLGSERSFRNPLQSIDGLRLVRPTYVCTTHGDFNQHNILVDSAGHTWLIDFLRTGPGHILRDLALLDSIIRLHLLRPEDATLTERLAMEEVLCSITRFSQVEQLPPQLDIDNPVLTKAYATVVHLRLLARRLVAQNPSDDIGEYSIALFYYALNTLRFYSLPAVLREHAVLCASLLADQLEL